jgi:tripartite-type tricarboxylate transporter receptor subunit TctC
MLPDVPAVAETLPGYQATGWFAFIAPAATPRPVVDRIYADSAKALQLPDVKNRLVNESFTPVGSSPQQFADFLARDAGTWAKVIKTAGIKLQ